MATGARRALPVEGLFVAIGTIPNADFLEGVLPVDKGGYIVADESGATSVPACSRRAMCARRACVRC